MSAEIVKELRAIRNEVSWAYLFLFVALVGTCSNLDSIERELRKMNERVETDTAKVKR